jgi:hypothetical protein
MCVDYYVILATAVKVSLHYYNNYYYYYYLNYAILYNTRSHKSETIAL